MSWRLIAVLVCPPWLCAVLDLDVIEEAEDAVVWFK